MYDCYMGLDIGGTKISCICADLDGVELDYEIVPTSMAAQCESFLELISGLVKRVKDRVAVNGFRVCAIGIGIAAILDRKREIAVSAPNIPIENVNLVSYLKEYFQIPVYMDNDANVATLGEYYYCNDRAGKNMVYITVSTGIGAGAIVDGKLFRGATNNAFNIGHTTLMLGGPRCNCGNYGCAEVLASGTAIARMAVTAAKKYPRCTLANYSEITAKDVFQEAENGDAVSKKIIEKSLAYLGILVSNVVTSFDPDLIVIGGGLTRSGDDILDTVKRIVKERTYEMMSKHCVIEASRLNEYSGLYGAVYLCKLEE